MTTTLNLNYRLAYLFLKVPAISNIPISVNKIGFIEYFISLKMTKEGNN